MRYNKYIQKRQKNIYFCICTLTCTSHTPGVVVYSVHFISLYFFPFSWLSIFSFLCTHLLFIHTCFIGSFFLSTFPYYSFILSLSFISIKYFAKPLRDKMCIYGKFELSVNNQSPHWNSLLFICNLYLFLYMHIYIFVLYLQKPAVSIYQNGCHWREWECDKELSCLTITLSRVDFYCIIFCPVSLFNCFLFLAIYTEWHWKFHCFFVLMFVVSLLRAVKAYIGNMFIGCCTCCV